MSFPVIHLQDSGVTFVVNTMPETGRVVCQIIMRRNRRESPSWIQDVTFSEHDTKNVDNPVKYVNNGRKSGKQNKEAQRKEPLSVFIIFVTYVAMSRQLLIFFPKAFVYDYFIHYFYSLYFHSISLQRLYKEIVFIFCSYFIIIFFVSTLPFVTKKFRIESHSRFNYLTQFDTNLIM